MRKRGARPRIHACYATCVAGRLAAAFGSRAECTSASCQHNTEPSISDGQASTQGRRSRRRHAASLLVISFPTPFNFFRPLVLQARSAGRTPLTGRSRPPRAVDICFPFAYGAAVIHGRRREASPMREKGSLTLLACRARDRWKDQRGYDNPPLASRSRPAASHGTKRRIYDDATGRPNCKAGLV